MIVKRNSRIIANVRNNSEISLNIFKKSFRENLLLMKNHDKSLSTFTCNLERNRVLITHINVIFFANSTLEFGTCMM